MKIVRFCHCLYGSLPHDMLTLIELQELKIYAPLPSLAAAYFLRTDSVMAVKILDILIEYTNCLSFDTAHIPDLLWWEQCNSHPICHPSHG